MAPPQWPSTWRCSNPHAPIAGLAARGSDPPQPGPPGGTALWGAKMAGFPREKWRNYGQNGGFPWKNWGIQRQKYGKTWEQWGINVGNIWKTWEN